MFDRAVELDSGYRPAWAGLATVHATLYEWFGAREETSGGGAREPAGLGFGPGSRRLTRHGALRCRCQDVMTGRSGNSRAIRLNPNSFDAYYYFARTVRPWRDRTLRRAFREAADVRQEDFQSPTLLAGAEDAGPVQEARDASQEGIRRAERILALNPVDARALSLGSWHSSSMARSHVPSNGPGRSLELHPNDMSASSVRPAQGEGGTEGASDSTRSSASCRSAGEPGLGGARSRLRYPSGRSPVPKAAGPAQ